MWRRLLLSALVLATIAVGVCFLSLQPLMQLLVDAVVALSPTGAPQVTRVQSLVAPLALLDGLIVAGLFFLALQLTIGSPLNRMQELIEQLAQDKLEPFDDEGPVLSRVGNALRGLARALTVERDTNRAQLEALRAANAELTRLQTELVGADRLATVGKLAAGVAHEVGNPLAGILGYLSVLRLRGADNAELTDVVNRIEGEVHRIDGIVRSLLELGRPSRGGAEPFELLGVVEGAVRLMRASADLREVSVAIEGGAGLWAKAEVGPLAQVLVNLLLNAAQAMGGQGAITVRLEARDGQALIHVDDEGPGIAPEVMPRLFELFFTTKAAGKGTGLGLAMSRHLLSQFGGMLTAENRGPRGARFTIAVAQP